MKKKVILMAVVMAAVLVGGTIYGCASGFGAVKVRTVSAERKSVSDSYTEDGSISLGDSCKIISEVSGPVEEVMVSQNQSVEKGDVLYRIGTEDYGYELGALKAQLSGYEAQLEKAKVGNVMTLSPDEYLEDLRKQKESAEAAYSAAASTYAAYTSLFSAGDVSKTDYDGIRAEYENAAAQVQSASSRYTEAGRYLGELQKEGMSKEDIRKAFYESDADAMEAGIDSTKAQIEKLSSKIDKCTVKAREDGIVSDIPVKNMTLVSVGQETAEIKTKSSPKVESDVLTSIVPYLHIGDGVDIKLSLRGKDEVYRGVISEIYDYADKGTSALGTDEYRVHVVMELDGAGGGSDAGDTGSTGQFAGDRDYVYTIKDGKAVKTEINVEYRTASDVVVKSGIAVGDKVIERADEDDIYDGARVKALK